MARERGSLRALIGSILRIPEVFLVVIAGIIIGLLLVVGGFAYDSVIFIIFGIIFFVICYVLYSAYVFLVTEAVDWLSIKIPSPADEKTFFGDPYSDRPSSWGNTYVNPYQAPPPRPPMRYEPGSCVECGGKLFLGRENCPHCGTPVSHLDLNDG